MYSVTHPVSHRADTWMFTEECLLPSSHSSRFYYTVLGWLVSCVRWPHRHTDTVSTFMDTQVSHPCLPVTAGLGFGPQTMVHIFSFMEIELRVCFLNLTDCHLIVKAE